MPHILNTFTSVLLSKDVKFDRLTLHTLVQLCDVCFACRFIDTNTNSFFHGIFVKITRFFINNMIKICTCVRTLTIVHALLW